MKTTTMPKKNDNVLHIHIDHTKIPKGHQAHRSGAGQHQHKGTKRNRTRSQQARSAMAGW